MALPDALEEQNTLVVVLLVGIVATVVFGLLVAVVIPVVGTFVGGAGGGDTLEGVGPQVRFSTAVDDGEVTITHAGGEEVRAGKLLVEVGGTSESWTARGGDGGTVEEDDAVTVAAESGTRVRILYDGESRLVLLDRAI